MSAGSIWKQIVLNHTLTRWSQWNTAAAPILHSITVITPSSLTLSVVCLKSLYILHGNTSYSCEDHKSLLIRGRKSWQITALRSLICDDWYELRELFRGVALRCLDLACPFSKKKNTQLSPSLPLSASSTINCEPFLMSMLQLEGISAVWLYDSVAAIAEN